MARVHLTATTLKKIKRLPSIPQEDYWDTEVPGFGVRLQKKKRVWFIKFKESTYGKRYRISLGDAFRMPVEEARATAIAILLKETGRDFSRPKPAKKEGDALKQIEMF